MLKFLKTIEKKAKSANEAKEAALLELGVSEEEAVIEIIEEGSKGFLGLGSKEATVKAIQAGVDIVLMPEDFKEAVKAVMDAVEKGDITEERINESVLRIIEKKLTIKVEE